MSHVSSRFGATLTINLDALAANYRTLKGRLSGARCAGVVKADAYGLGVRQAAPVLAKAGCTTFFVATLDEGIALSENLSPDRKGRPEIFVLNGPPDGAPGEFLAHDLVPVLNSPGQIAMWRELAQGEGTRLAAALHLDTGMARLGLSPDEVDAVAADPSACEGIDLVLVMSHLACADEPEHPLNRAQLDRFNALKAKLPAAPASLANSSGIFLGDDFHFDLARPGVALYGANPCPGQPNPMAEVVHLQGKIIQVRAVDSPMTVGYGATHSVARPGRVATVPVGYADGWPRALSNRGFAYVGDTRVPLVGQVSMDLITLDVTDLPSHLATPGTAVDLIGGHAAIDGVADAADTIAYEILTRLGHRYERVYIGGAA